MARDCSVSPRKDFGREERRSMERVKRKSEKHSEEERETRLLLPSNYEGFSGFEHRRKKRDSGDPRGTRQRVLSSLRLLPTLPAGYTDKCGSRCGKPAQKDDPGKSH